MRVIEVLGPGCPRCEKTTADIRAAVDRSGMDVDVRHVTDPFEIMSRGVLFAFPAVVVDGLLVSSGRVPSRREIGAWLEGDSASGRPTHRYGRRTGEENG